MDMDEQAARKLVIGWFSFTCCEDSTIIFTELLNDHFDEWKKIIEFRHVKALKTNNELRDLDVAFIEGAISSPTQAEEVKNIRQNSKKVVAIGNCACTSLPSAARNQFKKDALPEKIMWYYETFDYTDVQKLEDVIQVDDKVLGCPMLVPQFVDVVTKYLKEFQIIND